MSNTDNKAPASAETSTTNVADHNVVDINASESRIRVGFDNRGTINLDTLEMLTKIEFNDAKYSHFAWLDLNEVDTNTSNWKNIGIRDTNDEATRIESFRVSFRRHGYDMSEFPPCIDTDGDVMEGRTRIKAAILNGYRYMPVAVYTRSVKTERNSVTNGLVANQKKPVFMASFNDYVAAGVSLITNGQLKATATKVDDWLNHEVRISRVYDNSINGMITKIRNAILNRSKTDDGLVWSLTKSEAEKWIKTNLGLAKADFVLVNMADNETYAERAWRHVRDALKSGREPVNLIFYTTDSSPALARAGLKKSMEYVENLYSDSWEVVMSQLPEGVSLTIPTKRPFIFKGALPQIVKSHNINGSNLISVDKY
jgi:hypothetical protein